MTGCSDYPDSWYRATSATAPGWPAFEGSGKCEVCVIGGGLAGLSTALELAERGRSVTLLEAKRVGWGASGRNAGFVLPGFALGSEQVARRLGKEAAQALYRLSEEGAESVRRRVAALDPTLLLGEGFILAMRVADEAGTRRYAETLARDYGRETEVWPAERARRVLASPRYHEALYDPAGFHIHPLNYCLALAGAAARAGATLYEESPVQRLAAAGSGWRVETARGALEAEQVVLCTSGYGRGLWRPLDSALLPVATYIAVTPPLGPVLDRAVATPAAIADTRRSGDYYRRVDRDRLQWGGRITTRQSQPSRLGERMAGDLAAVYPQLGRITMDHAWSGLMGYALHKMPLIGRLAPGLWVATAFGGHGLNTTAMAGRVIATAIAEGDDTWRRFAPYGLRWAGGPFARIGLQATYWAMQARDRWDERGQARVAG